MSPRLNVLIRDLRSNYCKLLVLLKEIGELQKRVISFEIKLKDTIINKARYMAETIQTIEKN
ncbi:hypothetical protein BpHYR1_022508 [Brachionus plicatilis]|uniref:Uncharacterized protein n=1 Tax=Brachionus plicatilis TaxID=10195 RepID=A0A3M7R413_BRAPC|nr:hypothetical protein BpHYR1_022508 [Brachionus plicatilis]